MAYRAIIEDLPHEIQRAKEFYGVEENGND